MRFLAAVGSTALALVLSGSLRAASPPPLSGWLSFGNGPARVGYTSTSLRLSTLRAAWYREADGMVTTQPLVVRNMPVRGATTVYTATIHGRVVAYAPNGYVRWSRTLGAAPNACPQLDAYGVVGTPVVDPAKRVLYVADGFGLLHALDLATGNERAGWPVQLFDDPDSELVWGALLLVDGSVYAGTGSYCDRPLSMEGKLIRVDTTTRHVTSWTAASKAIGGGGSIWGWGGPAYSTARKALFVVTGNTFEGGSNRGASFTESAGYGEHIVELTPDLRVVAANHPAEVTGDGDFGFAGSAVLFTPSGCDEVAAAVNKDGRLFLWHTASIDDGPFASIVIAPQRLDQPLLSQPAYDPVTRSVYVAGPASLVRVAVDAGCTSARTVWAKPFPLTTLQGSPTVAGSVVWIAVAGAQGKLRGYDAATGAIRYERTLGEISFAPPAIVPGLLFDDARHGFADGGASSVPQRAASPVRAYTSWSDKRHGWQSRETGVYATDDGGRHWRRIYRSPAQRVLRLGVATGVIGTGSAPTACQCAERQLWTSDGGRTWHPTHVLDAAFAGAGSTIYTWSGSDLRKASFPPRRSTKVTSFPQTIADAAAVPGGIAVLLTRAGQSFDNDARLEFIRDGATATTELPDLPGRVVARGLTVAWPTVVVRTYVFTVDGRETVLWRSTNGGRTWKREA